MTDLAVEPAAASGAFAVHLANFEGPFDLLLSLISKHKLDVTEVALSQVTDEFIAHIKAADDAWDLEQTTSFLLVASTLLDLKAARLLPQGDVEDEEDLALLEARDLLFARLLQYKAFKQIADILDRRMEGEARRYPRSVGLEERFATLLPDVLIGLGLDEFASLAARALAPKPESVVSLAHIHAPGRERARAGGGGDGPAAQQRDAHVPVPGGGRAGHDDQGRAVPGAAGAVPRGRGGLRPDDPPRRAQHPLDGVRGRGGGDHRRVRRRAARGRATSSHPRPQPEPEEGA